MDSIAIGLDYESSQQNEEQDFFSDEEPRRSSFAHQMFAGKEGSAARRSSCQLTSIATALAEINEETDEEKEKGVVDPPTPSPRPGFGARGMSFRSRALHGLVAGETDSSLFQKTMGVSTRSLAAIVSSRRSEESVQDEKKTDVTDAEKYVDDDPYNLKFDSAYSPDEMRCLALVAHNHMKPAMKVFVESHKEILRKFRLTGTNTTITMLKEAFGDDPTVQYGPSFQSGPLGGDAELCALMCLEDLGGIFFFMDPLSAHPHQADIDSLVRLANVHNILTCINPCTAHAMCFVLKCALEQGRKDKIPSFFCTLTSPGVAVYKEEQKRALENAKK